LNTTLKILIVDDHRLFAAGLASVLKLLKRPVHIKEIYNGMQALSDIEKSDGYDLILADIEMPSVSGIDLLRAIKTRGITTPLVIVSATEHAREVERAMSAGAKGYIPKSTAPETMLAAVEKVIQGGEYLPEDLRNRIRSGTGTQARRATVPPTAGHAPLLSSRQTEILDLIENGKTNKQIAEVLGISQSTVKFHIAGLFRELNVRTRTECVHVARQLNIGGLAS